MPTAAFRALRLLADGGSAERVFRTSGTTRGPERRGEHHVADLELYRASLRPTFRAFLLPDDPALRFLSLVPPHAKRVGLVGAAISDHPKIVDLVNALADQGREVGLSSLRPDRLREELAVALRRAGHRVLTTAADGPSQRLRDGIDRKAKEGHFERAAHLVRHHGFDRLKLYMMVGLPTETDEDIDELARFGAELSKICPVALGIAPFVAKRNTPMDGEPFAGIDVVDDRLDRLRRTLRGRVDVRATSARWAWVEYVLAQGGLAEGRAVMDAVGSEQSAR